MADTIIYEIDNTRGDRVLTIQPRTVNGPGVSIGALSDLTLYGNAAPNWGERFNENFYRLLENFACEDAGGEVPVGNSEAGTGINSPVEGQLWYNTSNATLYMCVDPNANTWNKVSASSISDISGLQAELDAKVNRAGDANLTGVHSWPNLHLNEGNGNITVGSDIRMDQVGLISAQQSVRIHVDNNNDGTGGFVVARGDDTTVSSVDLFRVENNGTLHVDTTNYEVLITNNNDIPNKKYVDDEILAALGGAGGSFVAVAGDTMTGPLEFSDALTMNISFDNEHQSIRSHDGYGNFQLATGITHTAYGDANNNSYKTTGDGATRFTMNYEGVDGTASLQLYPIGAAGAALSGTQTYAWNIGTHSVGSARIINVADPINNQDAATRAWVLSQVSGSGGISSASLGVNGYVRFSNGFCIQWGRNSPTSGGVNNYAYTITLPITYTIAYTLITNIYATSRPAGGDQDGTGGAFLSNSQIRLFSVQDASHQMGWVTFGIV